MDVATQNGGELAFHSWSKEKRYLLQACLAQDIEKVPLGRTVPISRQSVPKFL